MVPVTNIELYEALKKDLNEDAARMIAEVVPRASDLATKSDVHDLEASIDAKLWRLTMGVMVPLCLTMLGTLGMLVTLVIKL
jgi:hypothetical protein